METKQIAQFYDGFVEQQQRLSYNERHYLLAHKLKSLGLGPRSNVLELGCGIGVMTSLIAEVVTEGRLVASDLSSTSVEVARKRLAGHANVDLLAGDLTEFSYPGVDFDFVTLFDVLEHVPIAVHDRVFRTLAAHMTPKTQLFINIPSPEQLEHLIATEPHTLQIVDQPLPADTILKHAYASALTLRYFETYSIWYEGDYQMMLFGRKQPFTNVKVERRDPFLSRVTRRLRRLVRGSSARRT